MLTATTTIDWDGNAVGAQILKLAGRGLQAATIHLSNRVKQQLSVPAPRKKSKLSGRYYATVPATPGAPPRKLSGQLRRSIAWQMYKLNTVGRVGTNLVYGRALEMRMNHSFLGSSLKRAQGELVTILGMTWGGVVGSNP